MDPIVGNIIVGLISAIGSVVGSVTMMRHENKELRTKVHGLEGTTSSQATELKKLKEEKVEGLSNRVTEIEKTRDRSVHNRNFIEIFRRVGATESLASNVQTLMAQQQSSERVLTRLELKLDRISESQAETKKLAETHENWIKSVHSEIKTHVNDHAVHGG